MQLIRAALRDNIHHASPRAAEFSTVGIGGDAELLDYFIAELIRRAVTPASLGKEAVIIVASIDKEACLGPANPSNRKISRGS